MSRCIYAIIAVFLGLLCPLAVHAAPEEKGAAVLEVSNVTKEPEGTSLSPIVTSLPLVPEGARWNGPESVVLEGRSGALVLGFSAPQEIRALILQGDNNDAYIVEGSLDGEQWRWLWTAPPVEYAMGVRARLAALSSPQTVRFLRVRPGVGDSYYSIARLVPLSTVPTWWGELEQSVAVWTGFLPFLTEKRVDALRPVIAIVGIIALLWCFLARAGQAPLRLLRAGQGLLLASALVAAACWWNFFNFHFPRSVHYWDFYHYYVGAKYFPELGYTGIYECTVRADIEDGFSADVYKRPFRDLVSNELRPAERILAENNCRAGFSEARWAEFKNDIRWFRARNGTARWQEQRQDHGFNGTPVWRLLPAAILKHVPLDEASVVVLASIDSLLLAAMWLLVAWAFGWETACAALLFWGTNFPGRYYWTGGSLLRHDWLVWSVASVCFLKRGFPVISGMSIAYAALLRVFPGFILAGFAAHTAARWIRERRLSLTSSERRFTLGVLCASIFLLGAGYLFSGRDAPYQEFIANSSKHLATPLTNNMGLKMIVSFSPETRAEVLKDPSALEPYARWKTAHLDNLTQRAPYFWGIIALYALLLVAAASKLPHWGALALGVTAIPMLAELTCYYYSVLSLLGLLWSISPLAVIGLTAVSWLTNVSAAIIEWYDAQYTAMSVLVVVFCFFLLLGVALKKAQKSSR